MYYKPRQKPCRDCSMSTTKRAISFITCNCSDQLILNCTNQFIKTLTTT